MMAEVGQFNTLKVIKQVPFGLYLDGGEWGEILLPNKFVTAGTQLGDEVKVFLYFDSEDEIIATTQRPRAVLGQFAFLEVIDINRVGAFLDWGLDKDLLVPQPEQRRPMEKGRSYIVYIKQDGEGRIVASSKIDRFLDKYRTRLALGDEVSLLIAETTELGNKVIVNDSHWGLIHKEDIFQELRYGKRQTGFVKNIREDGKIDVTLRKAGHERITGLSAVILKALQREGGFLPLHDKSDAGEIRKVFGESKKSFKSAIGHLYKQRMITIDDDGIRLVNKEEI